MKRVVHVNDQAVYDVYIGRPSRWGNIFSHKKSKYPVVMVDSAEEAVENYNRWLCGDIKTQLEITPSIEEIKKSLRGKRLGCFCKKNGNEPCHGDILVRIANEE